jgi:hypothetical protein
MTTAKKNNTKSAVAAAAAAVVSPQTTTYKRHKKKVVKRNNMTQETVRVERVANGAMVLIEVVRLHSDKKCSSGYIKPVHDQMWGDDIKPSLFSDDNLDISYGSYLFKRRSIDINEKLGNGFESNGKEYHRCVIPSLPNPAIYGDAKLGLDLKKVRDDFAGFLAVKANKSENNSYTDWNEAKDDLTKKPFRSLDHVLVDESVADILLNYYLPEGIDHSEVYAYMQLNGMDSFFTRNKKTGKYSKFAIERFSFPAEAL